MKFAVFDILMIFHVNTIISHVNTMISPVSAMIFHEREYNDPCT